MKKLLSALFCLTLVLGITLGLASCGKVEFKVNFVVDGEVYASVNTNGKETIKIPENPTKEGYIFDGWYWDKDTWQKPFTANSLLDAPLSSDMSVYAKFTDENSVKGTEVELSGFEKTEDDSLGMVYYISVSNSKIVYSLNEVVTVNNKSKWTISTDISGNDTIASKTVELSVGNNIYYLMVEDEFSNVQQYIILIRRRPVYTVTYYQSILNVHSTEKVEEGALANPPSLTAPNGYHFGGWSYDFSNPITSNVDAGIVWAPNEYTLTYDANGGSASIDTQGVKYGTDFTLASANRPGYTFDGWHNGSTKMTSGEWRYTSDVTAVAKWIPNSYSITYYLDGGDNNSYNPSGYNMGDSITLHEPIKKGYTFLGWTYSGVTEPIKNVVISSGEYGNKAYTANWQANEYNLTFNADGGNCDTIEKTVVYAEYVTLPTANKEGYEFLGWYDGTTQITSGYWKTDSDVELIAKYELIPYRITYTLNGGTNATNPESYNIITETFSLVDPVREGYEFLGWTYEGQSTPTKLVTIEKGSKGNIVFLANWEAKSFIVKFDANYGNCDTKTLEVTYDTDCTLPIPSKTGYNFSGWYYKDKEYVSGPCKIADNITLVAKWKAKTYTITYNANGGSVNGTAQTVTFDKEFALREPSRTGYNFLGWYNGEDKVISGVWTVDSGMSLKAEWQANSYAVTYDANGGAASRTGDTATYDSDFTLATAERVGYTFVGWYDGTKPYTDGTWKTANTVKLVAKWTANTDTKYVVNHHLQNIYDNGYTLDVTENLKGTSDASVTLSVKTYTGFTSPSAKTVKIAPDGSLVVDYYYTRNFYTISFVTNGGSAVGAQTYKYKEALNLPETERDGVTFGGWFTTQMLVAEFSNTTMPANDKTVYAWWQEENKPTDFTYTGTDAITISSFVGTSTTMWIPTYINDVPVTTIPESAFENEATLMKVVVPDTVTSIGLGAFKGCVAIEDITLPFTGASATATYYDAVFGYIFGYETAYYTKGSCSDSCSIGSSKRSSEYTETHYGSVLNAIRQYNCFNRYFTSSHYHVQSYYYYIPTSIKNVTITVQTAIPVAAFNNCDFIETINLSDTVENIGNYAFQNCNATINYFSTEE